MRGLTSGQTSNGSFVRSALMLSACTAATALLLLPYAIGRVGLAGPVGVVLAAAVCLICGWASEGLASLVGRTGSPLNAMLLGMAVRMAPPLLICLVLAARGNDGRRHLEFVCYLLAFYFVTLAVETWLAVKRTVNTFKDLK